MSLRQVRQLLVVMAKEPVPGEVKTRLFPQLSPGEAAALYRCFLLDRIEEMGALHGTAVAVADTPERAGESLAALFPGNFALFAQRGKDLGERLSTAFSDTLSQGYEAVSIIDSDSPDLPRSIVEQSFQTLRSSRTDVVFGPCLDGGYYLVGMKKACPDIFAGIPWSTSRVLETSLEKTEKAGLKAVLLPPWSDIDTFEDLRAFFRKHKSRPPSELGAGARTLSFLSHLGQLREPLSPKNP